MLRAQGTPTPPRLSFSRPILRDPHTRNLSQVSTPRSSTPTGEGPGDTESPGWWSDGGSPSHRDSELGLAIDSLLLSRPRHLKNGFRVFRKGFGEGASILAEGRAGGDDTDAGEVPDDADRWSDVDCSVMSAAAGRAGARGRGIVLYSLEELPIGVPHVTENGTALLRVDEMTVNLGGWNTISLLDQDDSVPEVDLDHEELLFTPPKVNTRPCAFCDPGSPGCAGAHGSADAGPAGPSSPSTAEAMLEKVTQHMLEQGVPLYEEGTDHGRVVFDLEELEGGKCYRSVDGLIRIRRVGDGVEFVGGAGETHDAENESSRANRRDPPPAGRVDPDRTTALESSFVVTGAGMPSIAEEALEAALCGTLQDGLTVVRVDCGRALLIRSIDRLPQQVEFRSLCGHVVFLRVPPLPGSGVEDVAEDENSVEWDLVINGARYPSRASANVTQFASFVDGTGCAAPRTPAAATAAATAAGPAAATATAAATAASTSTSPAVAVSPSRSLSPETQEGGFFRPSPTPPASRGPSERTTVVVRSPVLAQSGSAELRRARVVAGGGGMSLSPPQGTATDPAGLPPRLPTKTPRAERIMRVASALRQVRIPGDAVDRRRSVHGDVRAVARVSSPTRSILAAPAPAVDATHDADVAAAPGDVAPDALANDDEPAAAATELAMAERTSIVETPVWRTERRRRVTITMQRYLQDYRGLVADPSAVKLDFYNGADAVDAVHASADAEHADTSADRDGFLSAKDLDADVEREARIEEEDLGHTDGDDEGPRTPLVKNGARAAQSHRAESPSRGSFPIRVRPDLNITSCAASPSRTGSGLRDTTNTPTKSTSGGIKTKAAKSIQDEGNNTLFGKLRTKWSTMRKNKARRAAESRARSVTSPV